MRTLMRTLMKTLTKTLLTLLAILCFGTPAFSGNGTNVGGGGDGTEERYYPHDHERAPHHHDLVNPQVADDVYWHDINAWCSSTRAILQEYKSYARIAQGNFGEARLYLVKGLQLALDNYRDPKSGVPFELLTMRSLSRGLALNNELTRKPGPFEDQVVATLLSHLYTFIMEVNLKFDQAVVLPLYHDHFCSWDRNCPDCRPGFPCKAHLLCPICHQPLYNQDTFYAEFGKYVQSLLDFALLRAEGMGSDTYELLFFDNITAWATNDLGDSIFRRKYECVGYTLASLSSLICHFLNGEKTPFPNSRMLTNYTRDTVTAISKELQDIEYGRHVCTEHCRHR